MCFYQLHCNPCCSISMDPIKERALQYILYSLFFIEHFPQFILALVVENEALAGVCIVYLAQVDFNPALTISRPSRASPEKSSTWKHFCDQYNGYFQISVSLSFINPHDSHQTHALDSIYHLQLTVFGRCFSTPSRLLAELGASHNIFCANSRRWEQEFFGK